MVNLNREPTADELAGIEWWNSISEPRRADWLQIAESAKPATPGPNTSGGPSRRDTKRPGSTDTAPYNRLDF